MLTPSQIRDYRFQSAGKGLYKSDEVDEIYSKVIASYEQMYRENSELIKRVSLLAEKVEEYRRDEELIQKTLLVAQRKADEIEAESEKSASERIAKAEETARNLEESAQHRAEDTVSQAKKKSDDTVSDAEIRATDIINAANIKADDIMRSTTKEAQETLQRIKTEIADNNKALEELKTRHNELKKILKQAYESRLEDVNSLPDFTVEPLDVLYASSVNEYESDLEKMASKYEMESEQPLTAQVTENVSFKSSDFSEREVVTENEELKAENLNVADTAPKTEEAAAEEQNDKAEPTADNNEAVLHNDIAVPELPDEVLFGNGEVREESAAHEGFAPAEELPEPSLESAGVNESPAQGGFKIYMENLLADDDDDEFEPSGGSGTNNEPQTNEEHRFFKGGFGKGKK